MIDSNQFLRAGLTFSHTRVNLHEAELSHGGKRPSFCIFIVEIKREGKKLFHCMHVHCI